MTDPCGTPAPPTPGGMVLVVKARGFPATELCHQSSNQIVSESVDHLYKEGVESMSKALEM